ncbi:MAG: error-prone DNA polymerase [Sphingomonadales bacterium]|nr:error-prone DNA polymerase [Sphingomonadales bacterium]
MSRTAFAELVATTSYSFLRGASLPADMVAQAIALGLHTIGIADRNSVAGVVRAWAALGDAPESHGLRLVTGARLVFVDGTPDIIAYPATRHGWGRLTRLLTRGNMKAVKGSCILAFADLLDFLDDLLLIVLPYASGGTEEAHKSPPDYPLEGDRPPPLLRESAFPDLARILASLEKAAPGQVWLGVSMSYAGSDARKLAVYREIAAGAGVPLLATNDALYARPQDRPLHDIMTCIRFGTTIHKAGRLLEANAERHLKPPAEMARLFAAWPEAIAETIRFAERVRFDLGQLRYEYPREPIPQGWSADDWLAHLAWQGAIRRHPTGIPPKLRRTVLEELALIKTEGFAYYFLTVHDLVTFARAQSPPILCQGRGSAANSAVCFLLGVTSVDPMQYDLLFSRFISSDRKEPPDIDIDFEHERREEVMQYVYRRYGRHRAGIAATVIHYRPKSAVREVGKALGLTEDVTARLAGTVWGSFGSKPDGKRLREAGFDPDNPEIARLKVLSERILHVPRHLSQHVGGFVLTQDRLDETVPIHNAAMENRSFIEWDKDDIDALRLMKVDVLALGMLTCIRKAYDLMRANDLGDHDLTIDIDSSDPAVYDMLCRGDSIGVFQVESRAQINMLPRLKPRTLYDLTIQVAIVRPGPIQGDMVHPYLRRRTGRETISFPSPRPPHSPGELHGVLGKTLGVPLFQEQAMKLAIVAAEFTEAEANQLRRAMATFRHVGGMDRFHAKLVGGMVRRGYEAEFAERCYRQIEGFGSYGFPESHALSFARLVYVSAWIKCHYPAIFAAALLNSQPMGFYAPAQIVRDAREHGVEVLAIDANVSDWDSSIAGDALRLGLRQIGGFREVWADAMRARRPFSSIEDLARRASLPPRALRLLADADALRSLGFDRRQGAWEVRRTPVNELPLFAAARARELGVEPDANLPAMHLGEHVAADYQTVRLSLKAHPMQILRPVLAAEGISSCAAISRAANGTRGEVAGVVLVRQRPGNGKAIFITLEDETGVANIIMWARTFERFRLAVMSALLMQVAGDVQKSPEGVIHLMAHRIIDRTSLLATLSDAHRTDPEIGRADVFTHPQPPRHVRAGGHPRNVRTFPKSRDFH